MKKFRQKMAEKAGFTLVELIVVIAILGILAAVAVPAYSGYVKKANKAADLMTFDAVKTAVLTIAAEDGNSVYSIEVNVSSGALNTVTYKTTDAASNTSVSISEITDLIGTVKFNDGTTKGTWTAGSEWNVTAS